jgi:hypothetical protein
MSRQQSIHRLDKLLDRLPITYLRRARSIVNGVIPAVVALAAALTAGGCVVALCATVAYSAGPVFAWAIGSTVGIGILGAASAGTGATSSALTRAIGRREPLLSIVDDVAAAIGVDSPAADGLLAAVNGTLKAIFQPICGRHAVKTPPTTPALSPWSFVRHFK